MAKRKVDPVVGTDTLVGGVVTSVDYDGAVTVEKDGRTLYTEIEQDWGYCYCYDYGASSCSCRPTMIVTAKEKL